MKTTEAGGPHGYDAGKKINGRKRYIVVDTTGLLVGVVVQVAAIQDRDGARLVMMRIAGRFSRLKLSWADGGYSRKLVDWAQAFGSWILEIVRRSEGRKGFVVLPRRWVIERTLGWLGRFRRLSKDYEELEKTSEAMVQPVVAQAAKNRGAGELFVPPDPLGAAEGIAALTSFVPCPSARAMRASEQGTAPDGSAVVPSALRPLRM